MTNDIAELIRDAQERQAARAPAPERILGGLPRSIARRRRRRRYVVAAGVAGLLALSGGAVAAGVGAAGGRSGGSGVADAPAAESVVTMDFGPTWVPAGWSETSRELSVLGDTITTAPGSDGRLVLTTGPRRSIDRRWSKRSGDASTQLTLSVRNTEFTAAQNWEPVDVGGRPGQVAEHPGSTSVTWSIDGRYLLLMSGDGRGGMTQPLPREEMLGIAASVVADPTPFPAPVELGWLPAETRVEKIGVGGATPADYASFVHLHRLGTGGGPMIEVGRGSLPVGEPLTVGGRPAVVPAKPDRGPRADLAVDMGGGWVLVLTGDLRSDRAELIRIAENARLPT
jgi:hypothetical protein